MDSYDIDLEDLDLKSVDIGPNTTVTSPGNFKNVSFIYLKLNAKGINPSAVDV